MPPSPRLFHISDHPGIELFEPRLPTRNDLPAVPVVWAVEEDLLPNFLLPRNCPRVTFYASDHTTREDIAAFLGPSGATRVIAIEYDWLERLASGHLTLYEFDPEPFTLQDSIAGYWIVREPIHPISEILIDDLLAELHARDVELRVLSSLWALREAVIGSTLTYSIIRMQHAAPPTNTHNAYYPLPERRA